MILVTGASGFVGKALVAELSRRGRKVRIFSRQALATLVPGMPSGIEVARGDLFDEAQLCAAMDSVHTVIHLAGAIDGSSTQLRRVNVEGTRRVALAARQCGVRWFVHVSSAGVYGDARGHVEQAEAAPQAALPAYERSKRDGEVALHDALHGGDTGHVILRPSGIYGGARKATQEFLRAVAGRRVWIRMPPTLVIHPTPVEDIVQALVRCIDRQDLSERVFNIGGERALTLDDWALTAARAMNVRFRVLHLPAGPIVAAARGWRALAQAAGVAPPARVARACHPLLSRVLDTTKARQHLGFQPMPLGQALAASIAHARALGAL